jgi:DNA-binding CsgD family transcriptional regulator
VRERYPALATLRPAIFILITDPESQESLPVDRLRAAFGLTAAEAKLAAVLGSGEDLKSAASRLGITYGTARVRLAEIFQKTQTRRQAELVKVLLSTLPMR